MLNVQLYSQQDHHNQDVILIHLSRILNISYEKKNLVFYDFSFVQNCSCISNSTLDNHSQISTIDDQQSTRILSMNIPVDNSNNNLNGNPINSSSLNIEIEEEDDDDDDQRIHLLNENSDQNEQLEVFVGFYRPGEYQRETMDDDDDDDGGSSETSHKSDAQKKEEQVN